MATMGPACEYVMEGNEVLKVAERFAIYAACIGSCTGISKTLSCAAALHSCNYIDGLHHAIAINSKVG